MSGLKCKNCDYKLSDEEENKMLDGNLQNCVNCKIEFSPNSCESISEHKLEGDKNEN